MSTTPQNHQRRVYAKPVIDEIGSLDQVVGASGGGKGTDGVPITLPTVDMKIVFLTKDPVASG